MTTEHTQNEFANLYAAASGRVHTVTERPSSGIIYMPMSASILELTFDVDTSEGIVTTIVVLPRQVAGKRVKVINSTTSGSDPHMVEIAEVVDGEIVAKAMPSLFTPEFDMCEFESNGSTWVTAGVSLGAAVDYIWNQVQYTAADIIGASRIDDILAENNYMPKFTVPFVFLIHENNTASKDLKIVLPDNASCNGRNISLIVDLTGTEKDTLDVELQAGVLTQVDLANGIHTFACYGDIRFPEALWMPIGFVES